MSVADRTVDDILSKWYRTKTWRKITSNADSRPSCSAGEHKIEGGAPAISFREWDNLTLQQAKGESLAGAPLDERFRTIAKRYGKITAELGVVGPSHCKHIFIDPRLKDDEGKYIDASFRKKYINTETPNKVKHTLGEIWKNVLFGKFLNAKKELGWTLNRDWTCKEIGEPFYLLMIQGEESAKQRLQREQTNSTLDDLIDFVDKFSFGKDHYRKDTDALKNYVDLVMTSLKRYGKLAPEWAEKFEKIEDHIKGNLQNLISQGKELYVHWVATDGKTENLIYVRNGKKPILTLVDQGQRKELLNDWLQKIYPNKNPESFIDNDYFRCFEGSPFVYLGQMNFSIQIGEHIPESVKDEFAEKIKEFADTGYLKGEKKTGYDKDTANFSKNLINLGTLGHAVATYYTNRSPEWKALADTLMNTMLTDELCARFYPTLSPIKNIGQPPVANSKEDSDYLEFLSNPDA